MPLPDDDDDDFAPYVDWSPEQDDELEEGAEGSGSAGDAGCDFSAGDGEEDEGEEDGIEPDDVLPDIDWDAVDDEAFHIRMVNGCEIHFRPPGPWKVKWPDGSETNYPSMVAANLAVLTEFGGPTDDPVG